MSDWRNKITFLTPTFEEHEVNGAKLNFYPVGYRKLMELKRVGRPLAIAIANLFSDTKMDTQSTVQEYDPDPKVPGSASGRVIQNHAISVDILQFRERAREQSVDQILDSLTEESNVIVVAEVIMDSLREVFPRNPSKDDVLHFLNGDEENQPVDPGTLWELCVGVVKANKKVFDPLLERLRGFTGDLGERAKEAVQRTLEERLASRTHQNPNQEETKTETGQKEDGITSSSQTPSTDTGVTSKIP